MVGHRKGPSREEYWLHRTSETTRTITLINNPSFGHMKTR